MSNHSKCYSSTVVLLQQRYWILSNFSLFSFWSLDVTDTSLPDYWSLASICQSSSKPHVWCKRAYLREFDLANKARCKWELKMRARCFQWWKCHNYIMICKWTLFYIWLKWEVSSWMAMSFSAGNHIKIIFFTHNSCYMHEKCVVIYFKENKVVASEHLTLGNQASAFLFLLISFPQ